MRDGKRRQPAIVGSELELVPSQRVIHRIDQVPLTLRAGIHCPVYPKGVAEIPKNEEGIDERRRTETGKLVKVNRRAAAESVNRVRSCLRIRGVVETQLVAQTARENGARASRIRPRGVGKRAGHAGSSASHS